MAPQFTNVQESEEEIQKIKEISAAARIPLKASFKPPTAEEQKEADSRSVHMSNVDWSSTTEEIEAFFMGCGCIKRVTVPKDKYTGRQKNFAFVEFDSVDSATLALTMDKAEFRGRIVTVVRKRTNTPQWQRNGPQRGNGGGFKAPVTVKYVYVNAAKPNPKYSKRFAPY